MSNISNKNHWLLEQAKKHPIKIALQDDEFILTYSQLLKYTINAARHFKTIGIKSNDHISITSNNSIEFVITINALWLLGAVPVPLNLKLNPIEIEKLVLHSKSKILLNINNAVDTSKILFQNISSITLDDFTNHQASFQEEVFNINNIALMMYSSGSTGTPKCVQLAFNNLFESAKSLQNLISEATNDVWLASLPFYHIGGFSIITRSLLWGCTIAFTKSFCIEEMINSFTKYKPTYFSIVPTMLKKMLDQNVKPWKELKNIFIGGGPLNRNDIMKAVDLGFPLIGVYGSTETTSMVTAVMGKELFVQSGCAGRPLPGNTIEIVDNERITLEKMKIGEIGEIVISSKCVASSYFNYSVTSDSKILNQKFYSNDLGYFDENDNLFLVGRKDDMIISGGENFNLNEIESYTKSLSNISDCITIKTKDEKWGESYVLFITLNEKSKKVEERILDSLKNKFPNFKQPKSINFVDDLLRNELGKIDKKRLMEL
ncbi:MAG: class I adenylate-forming enzyme family protein [Melioribacteraceae bacterium]